MTVVVFGSINLDIVVEVSRLPVKGETVVGNRFFSAAGGKAANQAVAIAKLGISVSLVGQVGEDSFGETLIKSLQTAGVDTSGITVNPGSYSGIASIVVDERGDNTIACAAGANNLVREKELEQFKILLPQAEIVLLELGIPIATVLNAARAARANDCFIILDPAPVVPNLPEELYSLIDLITPNEIEASQIVGFTVDGVTTARQAASFLHQMGIQNVVITLGAQGALYSNSTESLWVKPIPVSVVDSVAAGDAFNGALAAGLASGKSLKEALQWGAVGGALAVTKNGAQSSLPIKDSFHKLLKKQMLLEK
ncbi:ribokinase [Waterburya agarophytonicola K14]|uniref:Ribokinase n=1 Tax=Waterburya agarophytonicola KI4 TaxID=2874699 RepID=A0A964BWG8_9CYAN|nr:ribokinase [Waterburya agarophytonicola]MCC0179042.1 ribokinase [Waterburya agarophytonicola KI4]